MLERKFLFFGLYLVIVLVTMYFMLWQDRGIAAFIRENAILILITTGFFAFVAMRYYLKIKYKIHKEIEKTKMMDLIAKWQGKR